MPRPCNIQGRWINISKRVKSPKTKAWGKENDPKPSPHHWALGAKGQRCENGRSRYDNIQEYTPTRNGGLWYNLKSTAAAFMIILWCLVF